MRFEPSQTPVLLAVTQVPLLVRKCDVAHAVQSFDVGPEQEVHEPEHGVQLLPSAKLPAGHVTPFAVLATAVHFVASFWSCVKLGAQVRQFPVRSAQLEQPISQTE